MKVLRISAIIAGPAIAIGILQAIEHGIRDAKAEDTKNKSVPVETLGPEEQIRRIKRQLAGAKQVDAQVKKTIFHQGPVAIRIAWQKPDFIFIHEARSGDNPEKWYWLDDGKLWVYEEWPKRGARGVCVTNFARVADGNADHAFELAMKTSKSFAYFGHMSLNAMSLLEHADLDDLEVSDSDTVWRGMTTNEAFNADLFKPFSPEGRTIVTFDLPKRSGAATGTVKVRVENEGAMQKGPAPESGDVTDVESIRFSVDRKAIRFPKPLDGSVKGIDLLSAGELRSELIDNQPITKFQQPR